MGQPCDSQHPVGCRHLLQKLDFILLPWIYAEPTPWPDAHPAQQCNYTPRRRGQLRLVRSVASRFLLRISGYSSVFKVSWTNTDQIEERWTEEVRKSNRWRSDCRMTALTSWANVAPIWCQNPTAKMLPIVIAGRHRHTSAKVKCSQWRKQLA